MKAGKNHYQVLDIPVNASLSDIKKAYRRLALVFHPDKHPDPVISIPKFNEIKEAYQVLVDPTSRRKYDREFHFQKYQPKETILASEADEVLQLCKQLWSNQQKQDPFRIDQDLLYFQICQILSSHNIRLVINKRNSTLDQEIIQYLMDCSTILGLDKKKELAKTWQLIANDNTKLSTAIQDYLKKARIWSNWEKYKIPIAMGLALLICIGIYFWT